jgi:hypothetical protein
MAAEARIGIFVQITGLSDEYDFNEAITISGVPAEVFKGHAKIGTAACDFDLGTIAPADALGAVIVATTGDVGILVNDVGTGTPSTSAGNQVLKTGEFTYVNLAGGLTAAYTIRLKGSVTGSAIKYLVFGK